MHLFAISSETARRTVAKFCMHDAEVCCLCAGHGLGLMLIEVIVTIYFHQIQHHITLPKVNKIQNLPSAMFLTLCRFLTLCSVPTFLQHNVSMGAGKNILSRLSAKSPRRSTQRERHSSRNGVY